MTNWLVPSWQNLKKEQNREGILKQKRSKSTVQESLKPSSLGPDLCSTVLYFLILMSQPHEGQCRKRDDKWLSCSDFVSCQDYFDPWLLSRDCIASNTIRVGQPCKHHCCWSIGDSLPSSRTSQSSRGSNIFPGLRQFPWCLYLISIRGYGGTQHRFWSWVL